MSGSYSSPPKGLQLGTILKDGALFEVGNDDARSAPQTFGACAGHGLVHPFPIFGPGVAETAMGEQEEPASTFALDVNLHRGAIGSHDGPGGIDDLFVKLLDVMLADHLRADRLKKLRIS